MRRLAVLPVAFAAVMFVACVPVPPGPLNGTAFEQTVANEVHGLRAAYGRPTLPWSNVQADRAQAAAEACAAWNGSEVNFPGCHTPQAEVLFAWPGGCAETVARAQQAVWGGPSTPGWRGTPPDLAYLVDYSAWGQATSVGVGAFCDTSTNDGWPRLYIVAALGHA